MKKYRARVVCGLGAALLAVGSVHAQQAAARKNANASALTAMDYIEIRQLVARYSYALDTTEDNGQAFARLFTSDGIFKAKSGASGQIKGRERLAAFARGDSKNDRNQGPLWVHTFVTNHVIQPSARGATGRVYVVGIDIAEAGNPGVIQSGGRFEDVYVKSAEGWRIKQRTYVPIALGPRDDATQPRAQQ